MAVGRRLFRYALPFLGALSLSGIAGAVAPVPSPATPQVAVSPIALIAQARLAEPLVRARPTSTIEDQALAQALQSYRQRTAPDDLSALTGYLAAYPHSGWAAAIEINLGLSYLHYGYFSRALAAWQQAWEEGKDATSPEARALVDRAVGERAQLYASFGQFDKLQALFTEIGHRPISGSATEQVQTARETLVLVKKDPRHLYLCGPKALKALLLARGASPGSVSPLDRYRATPNGTSLAQVAALADQQKLSYRLVMRKPGEPIPAQAIVHWKVGHFAAIVGKANGRIQIEDPVFPGDTLWITPAAFDTEASGYMLVPADDHTPGWQNVSLGQAATIWGKGPTNGTQPGRPGKPANPRKKGCPLCSYNIAESTVAITLADQPVGYDPPIGPSTKATISYDQREDSQPANFAFYNMGQKWTIGWLSYVTDDPTNPGGNVSRFMAGGGAFYYSGYNAATGRFTAQDDDGSVLILTSTSPSTYARHLGDGSVEVYAQSDGATSYPRNIFLTSVIDPQGNALQLTYDAQDRLTKVTDAVGRQTTLSYGIAAQPLKVTTITDPFGRSANFTYDPSGRLTSITDIIGLTSSFGYDANSLVNTLTTPYGTTSFTYTAPGTSGPPRFVDATDPLGNHEREEWLEPAPVSASDPAATVPVGMPLAPENGYLEYRDSFHWDKDQYIAAGCTPTGGCDYSKARQSHFLHYGDLKSATLESLKQPLENRVWYQYPGQPDSYHTGSYDKPIAVARVLDDGTTQISSFAYDSANYYNNTLATDPLGRTISFAYSNGIDLQSVAQKTANGILTTLAQYIYNTHHRPVLRVDASGQTTTYHYNAAGQILSTTDPLGHETQYQYNGTGDLTEVVNANGQVAASFTYDAYDRVATATDSEGYLVSYAYDAADRPTVTTYPDGTTVRYAYDKLDLASVTDRLARTWTYSHDANENLVAAADPAGERAEMAYSPNGRLTGLTDANNHTTSWTYDVEGRVTQKQYADGSNVTYAYENTISRLKSRTDALGQVKHFAYAIDNQVVQLSYTSTVHPTATVTFAYDPWFSRIVSVTDGVGTTQYSYGPIGSPGALQLVQTTGPPSGATITETYDELGRPASRTVAGSGAETFQYDALGRLIAHSSDLGAFTMAYLGQTGQITERSLTGSTLKTAVSYYPNSSDRRLKEIDNIGLSAAKYSNFQFASNAGALVTGITEASDAPTVYPTPSAQAVSYNNLNQITALSGQAYIYDANGNLTSDGTRSYSWDAENRLIAIAYPGQPGKATAFTYNGLGQRVAITRTPAGGGASVTTTYIWCGAGPCEARDASNNPIREYIAEGEFIPGTAPVSLYYGIDQLGSVRRVFSSDGTAPAYAYDPFGNPLQSTAFVTDAAFHGMFRDVDSALSLTLNRAYDPVSGRWLSRDPVGGQLANGSNLYPFAVNDPINLTDPLGLFCFPSWSDLFKGMLNHPFATGLAVGVGVGLCVASGVCEAVGLAAAADGVEGLAGAGLDAAAADGFGSGLAGVGETGLTGATESGGASTAAESEAAADSTPEVTCCFVSGTLVSTKAGLKAIQKLRVGDLVLSRDPASGVTAYKPIIALVPRHDREIYELTLTVLTNGASHREVFRTTNDHPWRTDKRQWMKTELLLPGARLVTENGQPAIVRSVRDTHKIAGTYNIEVADFHTYFVGTMKVWVHNACNIPQKIANQAPGRGWTEPDIQQAASGPKIGTSTNMATGNPASVYGSGPQDYVVVDDVTGDVIQISGRNDPGWIPDPRITFP